MASSSDSRSRQPIPWFRIGAEGMAIVVSILLAFGIQAWWEVRSARQTTQALLEALQVEWEGELVTIGESVDLAEANRRAMAVMIDAHRVGDHGLSPDSAASLYRAMAWRTYRPAMGAVNSLLLTDLDNVSPPELRSAIAAWPGVLEQAAPAIRALQELGTLLIRHDMARVSHNLEVPWQSEGSQVNELFGVQYDALGLAVIADRDFIVRLRQAHSVLYNYEIYLCNARITLEENVMLLATILGT